MPLSHGEIARPPVAYKELTQTRQIRNPYIKLSLVNRFGVTINYSKPSQKEYFEIVFELARKAGIKMGEDELKLEANKWELSHGGISGRTAQQFINHLMGLQA